MTREERLLQRIAYLKDTLARHNKASEKHRAQQREEARKIENKWRYQVGAIADEAGLRSWSTTDLTMLFQVSAGLGAVEHVLAVLEAGLGCIDSVDSAGVVGQLAELPLSRQIPYQGQDLSRRVIDTDAGAVVYVLQMEGTPWLKIGYTVQMDTRLASLQKGCPHPLLLRKLYPCDFAGALERQLHRVLAVSRRTGEWFETDLDTIDAAVRKLSPATWVRAQQLEAAGA